MASMIATVLAPGCFCTLSTMPLWPFTALVFWIFSMLSSTRATSESRTGWPWRVASTTFAKSAAFMRLPDICSISIWRVPSSWPMGAFEFAALSAADTSGSVRSTAASLSGSTSTRTA